jgi:hypothetical protein
VSGDSTRGATEIISIGSNFETDEDNNNVEIGVGCCYFLILHEGSLRCSGGQ